MRLNYTTYAFNIVVTWILTFKILLTGRFSKNCQKSPRILLNAWYQYRCFLTSTHDFYTRLMRLKHIVLTSVSGLISVSCAQGVTWGCLSDWDSSMFSVSSLSQTMRAILLLDHVFTYHSKKAYHVQTPLLLIYFSGVS